MQQSRFDPLHTAETEQVLLDKLPSWLATAASGQDVLLEVEYRGISTRQNSSRWNSLRPQRRSTIASVSSLRALYRADETPALQLSERAARMPGSADI